ncbi:MAG: CDP-alcohol phosphatidyltransferase family protein [Steroidobacteraceae bacterium]|jgi:phosphatidylglycerophosphate synthase|nr:CDP-alcohol phosphatidyltransferase family protein [Steroidobacteraceae bacterium]
MMPGPAHGGESETLRASARRAVALALVATAVAAASVQALLDLSPVAAVAAVAIAAGGALAVLRHLPGRHPHPRFGPANVVTLARAVPTALLAGLAVEPGAGTPAVAWFAALAALAVTVLDGVDGRLARRRGVASEFGARFDMETDSLLVLALAVLAWRWDRAGAWVLLSGLARYLFVAAGALAPWLRASLPPSRRRQVVCVVQIAVLLAVVAPVLGSTAAAALAAAGLLALAYSFGVDFAWLARRARRTGDGPTLES